MVQRHRLAGRPTKKTNCKHAKDADQHRIMFILQPPIVPKVAYDGDASNFDEYPEADWKSARTLDQNELKLFEDF